MITMAVGAPPLVTQLALVLVGTAIVGYIAQRLGIVPIVGYLVAGIVIGPNALGLVSDTELVDQMAEIGVIFLLFVIGLELSGDQLRRMGSLLFGGGAVQVGLTIALVTGLVAVFGVDVRTGIYSGCLVALSSTAVVLKMLSERRETNTPTGEVSVAFLIFQDIAVVLMVLLVPMLGEGGGSGSDILWAAVKAIGLIIAVIYLTKYIVPPVLDRVAAVTNNEEFLLVILAIATGVAWAVTLLGLTASLGAFIAGLVVSAGPHRERATQYVMPFQALFAAIFFASIGMLLDPEVLLEQWMNVLVVAVSVVVIKVIATGAAAALFKRPWPVVASASLLLAQVGEFSFILEKTGREAGLSVAGGGDNSNQLFIAAAVLLIAVTPVLKKAGEAAQRRLEAADASA